MALGALLHVVLFWNNECWDRQFRVFKSRKISLCDKDVLSAGQGSSFFFPFLSQEQLDEVCILPCSYDWLLSLEAILKGRRTHHYLQLPFHLFSCTESHWLYQLFTWNSVRELSFSYSFSCTQCFPVKGLIFFSRNYSVNKNKSTIQRIFLQSVA